MGQKRDTDPSEVIDLVQRRTRREDLAFGVGIFESDDAGALPANEGVGAESSLIDRIVVDETLPYIVASREGVMLHANDHYRTLDATIDASGAGRLSAGPVAALHRKAMAGLKGLIDDVITADATVRMEETVEINGKPRTFLGRFIPVRGEGRAIIAVCASYEDVTRQVHALRKAGEIQARFQDFARASSDWFFECNGQLQLSMLSERFTALVGQPAQLFIGGRLTQLGRFDANLDGENHAVEAMKRRKPFRDQLFVLESDRGELLKIHLSAVPFFDRASGDFMGYRGVGMDMTDRYSQAEDAARVRENLQDLLAELTRKNIELDDATDKAQTALKAKNEFLAAMSHELRTPLNAVIGFASAFERETFGPLNGSYVEHAGDIKRAGEHLLGLINDVLDVAVMESGGLNLRIDVLSVERLIHSAVQMVQEKADEKQLDTKSLQQDSQAFVEADQRRATQILVNLLTNAIKFTESGGSIGVDIRQLGNDCIAITIWDTGIGISAADQERVFEKFQQVTPEVYSRDQEGTGLGLHISRELARSMKGDIKLSSEMGKGSRFTLLLPRAADGAVDDDGDDFI